MKSLLYLIINSFFFHTRFRYWKSDLVLVLETDGHVELTLSEVWKSTWFVKKSKKESGCVWLMDKMADDNVLIFLTQWFFIFISFSFVSLLVFVLFFYWNGCVLHFFQLPEMLCVLHHFNCFFGTIWSLVTNEFFFFQNCVLLWFLLLLSCCDFLRRYYCVVLRYFAIIFGSWLLKIKVLTPAVNCS